METCCSIQKSMPIESKHRCPTWPCLEVCNPLLKTWRKIPIFLLLRMVLLLLGDSSSRRILLYTATMNIVMAEHNHNHNGYLQQKFAIEPQDQTAIVGSRVTLPCRVIGKTGIVQWTKDDFGLGAHRNLTGFERYTMIGSDEEGDYSLDISPVLLEDDAKYQCQVSPGANGESGIRSRFAMLSVLVPPDPPKIIQGPRVSATEDQQIELECISAGGKPAAEITWIDSEGNVITQNVDYVTEVLPDGHRVTARSILMLMPSKKHHNLTLTCQAQNIADKTYRAATVHLEVRYAPVVSLKTLWHVRNDRRAKEGAHLHIECNVEANPSNVKYAWYLNDQLVPATHSSKLVINNVTRELQNSIVRCEASNEIGRSEDSETLDIAYGPNFRTRPSDVEADLNSPAVLTCDIEANPPPRIVWLHEDRDGWSVVGRSPNLTLTVDPSTSGKYLCKVQGFPEIEAKATVYLKGPPAIISRHIQIGSMGTSAIIQCQAIAVPRPRVEWSYRGRTITSLDQDFSILEDQLPEGLNSTLVIRDSHAKHLESVTCLAINDYGSDSLEVTIIARRSFPLLIILSGVIGGAVVIVILTMILILCKKKKEDSNSAHLNKKPDVMTDAVQFDGEKRSQSSDKNDMKIELKDMNGINEMNYRIGYPVNGQMLMPEMQNGLLLQYPRFSNEFNDPLFYPTADYKDALAYASLNGYADYEDYNPAALQAPITALGTHDAARIQLSPLISKQQLVGHLNGHTSLLTNNCSSVNSSLTRSTDTATTVPCTSAANSRNNSLQRSGMDYNNTDPPTVSAYKNGPVDTNYNGKIPAELGTINTANPTATPAPPPYSGQRTTGNQRSTRPEFLPSCVNLTNVSICTVSTSPTTTQNTVQALHITKKGTGTRPALATHV